jgi:hypothetical protein
VNDFFFVDFLDYKTDSLVRRYYIKRVKVNPIISGYRQESVNSSTNNGSISPISTRQTKILLSPKKKNSFILSKKTELSASSILYDLINLKTGDTLHNVGAAEIKIPPLRADSEYLLQLYYSMQPETFTTYYLAVKPYWYRSKLFYLSAGSTLFLVLFLATAVTLRQRIKLSRLKQSETERHLRTLQAQLNPHFTFNALSSVQGLINTNRIDEANHYLQEFSLLLRKTLQTSGNVFTTLDREIEMMKTYIGLEKLRFDFSWRISVSSELQPFEIEMPTFLLQPIIENAIKHGISGRGSKGQLLIDCDEGPSPGSLKIVVKDNGKGFHNSARIGYGLKLTRERIEALNKLRKEKQINLTFNTISGTDVILIFNNWIDINDKGNNY